MTVIIYHNPACSKSRATLALLRSVGIEPDVIEYLKHPPDRETLENLLSRLGLRPRQLLREQDSLYADLGFDAGNKSDADIIDILVQHPQLLNRPIVLTPRGARLCRPPEAVWEILDPERRPAGEN
jgi:arsenate reductase (glutaredoxin)